MIIFHLCCWLLSFGVRSREQKRWRGFKRLIVVRQYLRWRFITIFAVIFWKQHKGGGRGWSVDILSLIFFFDFRNLFWDDTNIIVNFVRLWIIPIDFTVVVAIATSSDTLREKWINTCVLAGILNTKIIIYLDIVIIVNQPLIE